MQPLAEPDQPHRERHRHQQANRRPTEDAQDSSGQPPGGETERRATPHLLNEGERDSGGADSVAGGDLEQREEDHHADRVIEERLAGHLDLEPLGGPRGAQHPEDGNRIGRRDNRPEQQALPEIDRETADARHQQRQPADDHRRDRDADRGQDGDQGLFAEERVEVDLQGPSEQQEGEHPVQQRLPEMNPRHELAREVVDGGAERAGRHQRQRGHQRPDRHADRGGQPAEAAVDPVENARRDRDREQRKQMHDCLTLV